MGLAGQFVGSIVRRLVPRRADPGRPPSWRGEGGRAERERLITGIYRQVLARAPDEHELLHWSVFLQGGGDPGEVLGSLTAHYEYEENALARHRTLVPLPGFKIWIDGRDLDVGRQIALSGGFESHVGGALRALLKPGGVFLDLGANVGYFSLLAAGLVTGSGRVLSFEPNAQNLRLFHASIAENGFRNVVVFPFAVSDAEEILKLRMFGSNGFLAPPGSETGRCQYVQAVLVDRVLASEPRLDVVKMDIEGYEVRALAGMREIVRRHRPAIVTEFNPWHIRHRCGLPPERLLHDLEALGYRIHLIQGSGEFQPTTAGSLHDQFLGLNNDKMCFDLLARPL